VPGETQYACSASENHLLSRNRPSFGRRRERLRLALTGRRAGAANRCSSQLCLLSSLDLRFSAVLPLAFVSIDFDDLLLVSRKAGGGRLAKRTRSLVELELGVSRARTGALPRTWIDVSAFALDLEGRCLFLLCVLVNTGLKADLRGTHTLIAFTRFCNSRSSSALKVVKSRSSSGGGVGVRGMRSMVLSASALTSVFVNMRS